ncbi:MAG: hypothetical protein LIO78_08365 [Clostridiales bacterium]|nr:hypothetical protein [Clostridiales bacterium]MCC8100056.1 hypothetical protein [Clostridiales bacterium]
MAEHGKLVCLLEQHKASLCHPPTDCPECRGCGREETEALRRKAAIRAGGARLDKATGKYCLKIRKEREHD